MKTDILLKDPIFQLNLLLWMSKEQAPDYYYVNPFFYQQGFKIMFIEQPFKFPEETAKRMIDSGLDIGTEVEPDILLNRDRDSKALYFELKANSFSIASPKPCKQARGHLIASGSVFSEVYSPIGSCLLCYVIPASARDEMRQCLLALQAESKSKEFSPGEFSVHGLSMDNSRTQIMYSWDSNLKSYVELKTDDVIVMSDITEDTNPTPLMLVFSDEDCSNQEMQDFYRNVLIQQVRVCLLCDLHSLGVGLTYETTPEKILMKTSDGIFEYLGRKRQTGMIKLIRENMFKRIVENWGAKQSGIKLIDKMISISWKSDQEKREFLDWLEDHRIKFDTTKSYVDSIEINLFDDTKSQ